MNLNERKKRYEEFAHKAVEVVRKETNIPFTFEDAMELYKNIDNKATATTAHSSASSGIWYNLLIIDYREECGAYITLGMYKDKEWFPLYNVSCSDKYGLYHNQTAFYNDSMKYILHTTTGELSDLFDL